MKYLKSLSFFLLLLSLSGCFLAPGLVANQVVQYAMVSAIHKSSKEKPPKKIELSAKQDIIKVVIEVKHGILNKGSGKDLNWAKAATVIKADEIGCIKTKSIPYSDAQVGAPSILGGLGGTSITNTVLSKCIRDEQDMSGESIADQKIIYEQYIAALKQENLITYAD